MSTIDTSWPARASRSASPAPTRPQPMITARTACSTSNSFGRPAVAARAIPEAPAGQTRPAYRRRRLLRLFRLLRCNRGGLDGGWRRRDLLAHDDDLAGRVLEDVRNGRTDGEIPTEARAVGQSEDDRVGSELDRFVDQRRSHLA